MKKNSPRTNVLRLIAAGSILTTLLSQGGCGGGESSTQSKSNMQTLSGSATYRERMMIPDGAQLQVTLEDVSKQDVPSEVIAESLSETEGAPPYAFELEYDGSDIKRHGRYAIRAKINVGDRLIFTTTEFIPAFDASRTEPLEITLTRAQPLASLANTRWKVLFIKNTAAKLGAGDRELYLTLNEAETGVKGFSGCNTFVGSYEYDESTLRFGNLASTQMACVDGMKQEQQMLEALRSVANYKINGNFLTLSDESGTPLLRCEALYLQ